MRRVSEDTLWLAYKIFITSVSSYKWMLSLGARECVTSSVGRVMRIHCLRSLQ